jgi:hypothetical protein
LRGRTVSEKLPKLPLFGPSLIHQLRLPGSQQHPQSGVLLTSFSTWGTENSLLIDRASSVIKNKKRKKKRGERKEKERKRKKEERKKINQS